MTQSVQENYTINPDPAEPPEAEVVRVVETRGGKRVLELRANIGGQDRRFLLALDALEDHGLSGPAAVKELREIREALGSIADLQLRQLEVVGNATTRVSQTVADLSKSAHDLATAISQKQSR